MVRAKGYISPYPIIFPPIPRLVCLRPSRSLHIRSCFPRFAQENTFQHQKELSPFITKTCCVQSLLLFRLASVQSFLQRATRAPNAPLQEECDLQVTLFSVQLIGRASIHAIPTAIHSFARTPPHRETERHDRRIVLGTRLTGTRHSDLHAPAGGSSGRIQLPFAHTDGSIPTAHKPVMLFPPPSGPSHPPPGGVSPYPPRTPAIIGYPLRS